MLVFVIIVVFVPLFAVCVTAYGEGRTDADSSYVDYGNDYWVGFSSFYDLGYKQVKKKRLATPKPRKTVTRQAKVEKSLAAYANKLGKGNGVDSNDY